MFNFLRIFTSTNSINFSEIKMLCLRLVSILKKISCLEYPKDFSPISLFCFPNKS